MTAWTSQERAEIEIEVKIYVTGNDTGEWTCSLLWIHKCENISPNPDTQSILKITSAYKNSEENVMNKTPHVLFDDGKRDLKTAQSLKAMLEELVLYRADRILDHFKKEGILPRRFIKQEAPLLLRSTSCGRITIGD